MFFGKTSQKHWNMKSLWPVQPLLPKTFWTRNAPRRFRRKLGQKQSSLPEGEVRHSPQVAVMAISPQWLHGQ